MHAACRRLGQVLSNSKVVGGVHKKPESESSCVSTPTGSPRAVSCVHQPVGMDSVFHTIRLVHHRQVSRIAAMIEGREDSSANEFMSLRMGGDVGKE